MEGGADELIGRMAGAGGASGAGPAWQGKVLVENSDNLYTQSPAAARIAGFGEEKAKKVRGGFAVRPGH